MKRLHEHLSVGGLAASMRFCLRSIVVLPRERGRGHGGKAVSLLMGDVAVAGAQVGHPLTEGAAAFFEALGFVAIDRATAPKEILGTAQAAGLCPASARMFRKPTALWPTALRKEAAA